MNKKTVCAFALFAGLCALSGAQTLGTVDYLEGSVSIQRNGEALKKVDIGTKIENLDLVKTSADGTVSIAFDKTSGLSGSLQVVPASTAIIRRDQISGSPASEVQLLAGSVNLKVKRLVKGQSSVQIRTPTSVLGVRGTEFSVATFNGSSIVACKEGEVYCASSSGLSVTRMNLSSGGASVVPGKMVEVLESGKVNSGDFPGGDYETAWDDVKAKWMSFNVGIISEDPVSWLNNFVNNWTLYAVKVDESAKTLRANATLKKWLKDAASGSVSGGLASWAKEKPAVMKDLIALRPDMMVALITWSRINDILPNIPPASMNQKLANGQTVRSFADQFARQSKSVVSAVSLFEAAEKLYMQRNDGLSPFSEF
jgi:hypothetical protein